MAEIDGLRTAKILLCRGGHGLGFRAEAFNAFNHANLYNPILDINNASQFGGFESARRAPLVQVNLRYSF